LWYLRRDVPAFVLLASGLFGLILFQYLFYDFRMRHGGIYLSCLFASMWLNREGPAPAGLVPRALWGVALAASAYVGFLLAGRNIDLPRSYGCATAEFIRSSGWAGDPLIGFPAKQSSTVVGCGQFPRAYYADAGAWGSFVVWNSNIPAVDAPVAADPVEALRRAVGITGAPVTLIAGYGVEEGVAEQLGFRKVADFREPGPIMTDEIYTLYRLEAR
jgi:hypothetical protein